MDNKYSVYRYIRYNRTYRTLGKMSLWRVVLGIALIIYVLLLSGLVSQIFAGRGGFRTAEKLMVSPEWMERYKPETKAFIEAGVLYQDGELEAAAEGFGAIKDFDAATAMYSVVKLELAKQQLDSGDMDSAFGSLAEVDITQLNEDNALLHLEICRTLHEHYSANNDSERSSLLQTMLDAHENG